MFLFIILISIKTEDYARILYEIFVADYLITNVLWKSYRKLSPALYQSNRNPTTSIQRTLQVSAFFVTYFANGVVDIMVLLFIMEHSGSAIKRSRLNSEHGRLRKTV